MCVHYDVAEIILVVSMDKKAKAIGWAREFRLECFFACTTFLHISRFVKPLAGMFYITLYVPHV
jgi:hypothetical protein